MEKFRIIGQFRDKVENFISRNIRESIATELFSTTIFSGKIQLALSKETNKNSIEHLTYFELTLSDVLDNFQLDENFILIVGTIRDLLDEIAYRHENNVNKAKVQLSPKDLDYWFHIDFWECSTHSIQFENFTELKISFKWIK